MPRRAPPLSDVLFALADPTRLRVVSLLGRAPHRASELAEAIGASRPAMSRHLRILREAGVLTHEGDESDGRARLLALERAPFDDLRAFLDEIDRTWSERLDAFKALAEARAAERAAPRRKKAAS